MRRVIVVGLVPAIAAGFFLFHPHTGAATPRCSTAICALPYRHEVCLPPDGACYWTNRDGYPIGEPITVPSTTVTIAA